MLLNLCFLADKLGIRPSEIAEWSHSEVQMMMEYYHMVNEEEKKAYQSAKLNNRR